MVASAPRPKDVLATEGAVKEEIGVSPLPAWSLAGTQTVPGLAPSTPITQPPLQRR